jgi:hypothetical protein
VWGTGKSSTDFRQYQKFAHAHLVIVKNECSLFFTLLLCFCDA